MAERGWHETIVAAEPLLEALRSYRSWRVALRVLFVNPGPYLPQVLGGVETTTFDLCRQLTDLGHESAVMCQVGKYDLTWARNRLMNRLTRRSFPRSTFRGAIVYRGYLNRTGLDEVLADFGPDVLVVAGSAHASFALAAQCAATGVPTAFYFHELTALRKLKTPELLDGTIFLANSTYSARVVRELLGRDAIVMPPLVDIAAYRTVTARQYVTMVNPRKIKGGATALALAQACPDIPFVFVEAWQDHDSFVAQLRATAAKLPNVSWHKPTNQMLGIYAGTRILLVPSEWEETWGRVVTEAHASGIPVLASRYAALPESVGPGGMLIEPRAPIEEWARALRAMWDDHALYDALSAAALEYSQRPEAQPARRAAEFIEALRPPVAAARPSTDSRPALPYARR